VNVQSGCIGNYWNVKVGNKEEQLVVGKYGLGDRNNDGDWMIEFCETNDFVIKNTFFHQHKQRLCTWTSPDGIHSNQNDYVYGKRQRKSSISSVRTRLEQKDFYVLIIDYSKAFDWVDHKKFWITLQRVGIPGQLILLMRILYVDQEATTGTQQWDIA